MSEIFLVVLPTGPTHLVFSYVNGSLKEGKKEIRKAAACAELKGGKKPTSKHPPNVQGQAGCGSGQPGLEVGDPAHSRGLKLNDHCGPFQSRPFYDPN